MVSWAIRMANARAWVGDRNRQATSGVYVTSSDLPHFARAVRTHTASGAEGVCPPIQDTFEGERCTRHAWIAKPEGWQNALPPQPQVVGLTAQVISIPTEARVALSALMAMSMDTADTEAIAEGMRGLGASSTQILGWMGRWRSDDTAVQALRADPCEQPERAGCWAAEILAMIPGFGALLSGRQEGLLVIEGLPHTGTNAIAAGARCFAGIVTLMNRGVITDPGEYSGRSIRWFNKTPSTTDAAPWAKAPTTSGCTSNKPRAQAPSPTTLLSTSFNVPQPFKPG